MYRTLTCLAFEHDYRLVALAAITCVLGSITAFRVLQVALQSDGLRRWSWLVAATVAGGGSIWSTHFIAMLAYAPGVAVGYASGPILASLLMALLIPGAGLAVSLRAEKWAPYAGGILVGTGTAALHYVGMTGVLVPGRLEWDSGLVVASMVYSVFFSTLALIVLRRLKGDQAVFASAAALCAAVVLLHFTGMGALTIVPDPSVVVPTNQLPSFALAAAAAAMTCFILAVSFICVLFDRRIARAAADADSRMRHLAYHDALTGLPNRTFFAEAMQERLGEAAASGRQVAMLAIDLDRFKQVNDIFGHQAGDDLLRALARIMSAVLEPGELLARVGGDEFIIVQSGVAQPNGAERLASRLLAALCRDVDVEGATFRAAASVGIALFPRDGADAETLHSNADAALYRAKNEGRGIYRIFEPEMDLQLRERRALQMEMRDALKRGEFKLYYQPQAETTTGVISGFEALLRWEHPVRGLVGPNEFISAAEENGFIVELGEFVLRSACVEAASWSKPLNIAVNLSPVQFQHGDLVGALMQILNETGLDPSRLEIEITESVLIHDFDRALGILNRIKALGVSVAMDDFGTGYSSLAYLQAFPFDRIKIDRSFISALDSNTQSAAIIRAIVGLGRGLQVPVTAEGVETEEQQAFLARLDCSEIQGYLVGRPQPIERLDMHVGRDIGEMVERRLA